MNKEIKKILFVLALYALSGGIFYNFQELWLAENNMSIGTISTVFSLCALITVSVIFLCSNIIKPDKIKKFALILISIKTVILLLLFVLNNSNLNVLIKFLTMVDYAVDTEIYACVYPLMSMISKENKLYAVRGLVYDISYYIGVILVAIFLGRSISIITFSYNTYCLIAAIIMLASGLILSSVNINKYLEKSEKSHNNDILIKLIKKIKGDKISIYYIIYAFFSSTAYYSLMGILLTTLISEFNLEPTLASNIKLVTGIIAVGIGTLILSKLTLKNDYINIGIKFIGRLITYIIPLIHFSKITLIIGLLYTGLTSSSYSHVTEAPYINRFNSEEQLAFANLKDMISYFSRALGTYLCGIGLTIGIRINFGVSAGLVLIAIIFAYLALYYRKLESRY